MKQNGGVVNIVAYAAYVKSGTHSGRAPLRNATGGRASAPCPVEAPAQRPLSVPGRPGVKEFVDHIDYAVRLIGATVGISSDCDGRWRLGAGQRRRHACDARAVRPGYARLKSETVGQKLLRCGATGSVARRRSGSKMKSPCRDQRQVPCRATILPPRLASVCLDVSMAQCAGCRAFEAHLALKSARGRELGLSSCRPPRFREVLI